MAATLSVDKSLTLARQAAKKQDWLTAVRLNRSVLERFPGNKKAAKALADIRVPAAEGLMKAAGGAAQKEDWTVASDHFEAAYYLVPTHRGIAMGFAKACLEAETPLRALEICDALSAAHPKDAEVLLLKGQALHHLGRADDAVALLQQALGLAPDNASTETVRSLP